MSALVVMALAQESQGRIERLTDNLLYTGVGKINAALHLSRRLATLQLHQQLPTTVINLGSAGSHQFELLQLVNCTRFIQHDMNATALGFELGQTPFELGTVLEYGQRVVHLPEAHLHSGDQFITDNQRNLEVIDMEGYAIAKVCAHFEVPLVCVKFISDNANHQSALSWPERLDAGSQLLARFLQDFIHNGLDAR